MKGFGEITKAQRVSLLTRLHENVKYLEGSAERYRWMGLMRHAKRFQSLSQERKEMIRYLNKPPYWRRAKRPPPGLIFWARLWENYN